MRHPLRHAYGTAFEPAKVSNCGRAPLPENVDRIEPSEFDGRVGHCLSCTASVKARAA